MARYLKVVQAMRGKDSYDPWATARTVMEKALPKAHVGPKMHGDVRFAPISKNVNLWSRGPMAAIRLSVSHGHDPNRVRIERRTAVRKDGTIDLDALAKQHAELSKLLREQYAREEQARNDREARYRREKAAERRVLKQSGTKDQYAVSAWEDESGVMLFRISYQKLTEAEILAMLKAFPKAKEEEVD